MFIKNRAIIIIQKAARESNEEMEKESKRYEE